MVSRLCKIVLLFITIIILLVSCTLIIPKLFGLQIYGVLSGSMEPTYKVGSVVYVKSLSPNTINIGDAITFHIDGRESVVATHRVIDINYEEQEFITKGDANAAMDGEPIPYNRIIGKVVFTLPIMGYAAIYIQTKQGIISCIGILLFMIFLSLLDDVSRKITIGDKSKEQI